MVFAVCIESCHFLCGDDLHSCSILLVVPNKVILQGSFVCFPTNRLYVMGLRRWVVNSMELEVLRDDENPLLDRRELMLRIFGTPTTPSRGDLLELIAARYGARLEHVVVEKIITEFGRQDAVVDVRIYADPTIAERTENAYVIERSKKSIEKRQTSKTPTGVVEEAVGEVSEE
ncbi:hypothetical protein B6U67_04045 [Methanosarcinales archaeon ex4484_138]|nr:MAG: hypothetical protein B6U67_04045 [Methanosarcinales archaeon ex4484_138]RLG27882.1 MAG: hypothetical protein DRN70_01375 [Methanosarcinales archaeon]